MNQKALVEDLLQFQDDPLNFVRYVFPWKVPGTPLENEAGPDEWQTEFLIKLGDLSARSKLLESSVQMAVTSGHGVGKTALVSFILIWFISTRFHPQIVVTANTKAQLTNKTWRELAKWHQLAIHKSWFTFTATRFALTSAPETWFASAIPWSEHNSEAFAGTHEKDVLVLFDEASAIPPVIWDVVAGAMTTPGAMHLNFGNPTRNTGPFYECFHKFRHRWDTYKVDARKAKMVNQVQVRQWIEDYGEDSDFVRVRVRGEFPRAASTQFISRETAEHAAYRPSPTAEEQPTSTPLVLSADIARYGDDQTVIALRQGRVLYPLQKLRPQDLMETAAFIAHQINESHPDSVFIDGVGMGAGVVDRLRQLGYRPVDVQAGARAQEDALYINVRMEMWQRMKEWLPDASIPDDTELIDDLASPEYGFDNKMRMQLERKEDMKKRGLASPDCADAVALGFAYPTKIKATESTQNLTRWTRKINDWRVL